MFMRPCVPVLIGSCFAAAGAAAQSGSVVLYGSLDVAITLRTAGWRNECCHDLRTWRG